MKKIICFFLLFLACFSLSFSVYSATPKPNRPVPTLDMKQIFPFSLGKALTFYCYDASEKQEDKFEVMYVMMWPDQKHFTISHTYGNSQKPPTWFPRVDDVFVWDKDALYYTNTYDFYKKEDTHYIPGHLWADAKMSFNTAMKVDMAGELLTFESVNGEIGPETLVSQMNHEVWRQLIPNQMAWSPFTGVVSTFRLDEVTYLNQNKEDWFKEEWYFYQHPQLGFIPVQTKGYRKTPDVKDPILLWNEKLATVQNS